MAETAPDHADAGGAASHRPPGGSPDRAPGWVVPVMRVGYGSRGIVYVAVGVLALLAAWHGRPAEGAQGAMEILKQQPWGIPVLIAVAVGMFAYALWRGIDSLMDLENYGTDARGIVARTGMIVTGVIHLGLGLFVLSLLTGGGGGSAEGVAQAMGADGADAESVTAALLRQPWGRWAVGIAGACTVGAGIYYAYKGWSEKYKEKLHRTAVSERLNGVMKFGLYAHALVVSLIGLFLIWAAWTYDPSAAGGLDQAFEVIRGAIFGRLLLAIVALGLVGFAVFCFVEAVYRIVPRRAGTDVATLASRVGQRAEAATRKAEAALTGNPSRR